MRNYLSELNEMQREAVLHKDGPIIIIAGALQISLVLPAVALTVLFGLFDG